jgi:hypothetical protein
VYTLVTILFAWSTWGFDQVGVLIFFMFTMALLAMERGQWAHAGLWLALLLALVWIVQKPGAASELVPARE